MEGDSDSIAANGRQKQSGGRRTFWLAAAIVALAGLWSGVWYWEARQLDAWYASVSQDIGQRGGVLSCQNRQIKGYPFRIGMFCDRFAFAEPRGASIDAGALRTAAQVYAPGRIVGELDGPVEIAMPTRERFGITYQSARMSGRIGFGGPQEASVVLARPVLLDDGAEGTVTGDADELQLHVRRNPEAPADLDVAASGASIKLFDINLPTFSISADVRFARIADVIGPGFAPDAYLKEFGIGGDIRQLAVTPEAGGSISLSGAFKVDKDGLLDGDFSLAASEFASLASFLSGLFPKNSDEIRAAAGILAGFSKPAEGKDAKESQMRVAVRRGKIQLGFLRLGEIGPLW